MVLLPPSADEELGALRRKCPVTQYVAESAVYEATAGHLQGLGVPVWEADLGGV